MTTKSVENEIKSEVEEFHNLETKLLVLQSNLAKNKEFRQFLKLQDAVNNKADEVWDDVRNKMVENDVKSIDADWVKLTIVPKPKIEVVGNIAPKFMKRVPDVKKINSHIKETGEVPEGVKQSETRYLRKTFRSTVS